MFPTHGQIARYSVDLNLETFDSAAPVREPEGAGVSVERHLWGSEILEDDVDATPLQIGVLPARTGAAELQDMRQA
jgi:hypothetical protein